MKDPLFYKVVRPLIVLWFRITFRPTIINKNIIPKKGRAILAGTHTNDLDCVLLGVSTKRCVRFLAKDSLVKGFKGPIFKGMGVVPVNRSIHDKTVIPAAVKLLNNERLVGIFPEGTINRTNDIIMPFKPGAIKIALESDTAIIPFAIIGKYQKFKKSVKIIFGDSYKLQTKDITKELQVLEKKVIELLKLGEK